MTAFSGILNRYGEKALIIRGEDAVPVRAFIQPIMVKNGKENAFTRLGEVSEAKYYYFGPPEAEIAADGAVYISCQETDYDVVRAEKYTVLGRESHWEAVLTKREA